MKIYILVLIILSLIAALMLMYGCIRKREKELKDKENEKDVETKKRS